MKRATAGASRKALTDWNSCVAQVDGEIALLLRRWASRRRLPMRFWRRTSLRQIVSSVMLLAMLAFVPQSAIGVISRAAAATGLMPDPAVTLGGSVHYHGTHSRHVHAHHGDDAGHVHHPSDADADDADNQTSPPTCSLGIASAIVPLTTWCPVAFESMGRIALAPHRPLTSTDPGRLSRPPSTPGIA
jgi:hypothetical protein